MIIYCRGYYGYKNLWDELLLFWVLDRIVKTFPTCTQIDIEADDIERLQTRLDRHPHYLDHLPTDDTSDKIITRAVAKDCFALNYDHIVIWGWEVLSDARPFPYNGRIHLIRFRKHIILWTFSVIGWVWTRKHRYSRPMFKILLAQAEQVVVRDNHSYTNTLLYTKPQNVTLHTDFALQFFENQNCIALNSVPKSLRSWFIINTNPYLWNDQVRATILNQFQRTKWLIPYFVPAEIWADDEAYESLKKDIPELQYYNWTEHSVEEIVSFLSTMHSGVATRLHIMLLLSELEVPYTPLVYQEKITHLLGHKK